MDNAAIGEHEEFSLDGDGTMIQMNLFKPYILSNHEISL